MLPIILQMQIDLSVAAHHREVAEGFAKLRGKLPPPTLNPMARLQELLRNAAHDQSSRYNSQINLAPMPQDRLQGAGFELGLLGGLASSALWGDQRACPYRD